LRISLSYISRYRYAGHLYDVKRSFKFANLYMAYVMNF